MKRKRWSLGMNTCGDLTLAALDTLAEAGFTHVYVDHLNWNDPSSDYSDKLLEARPWIKVHGVHLPVFLGSPPGVPRTAQAVVEYFTGCIRLAARCSIPNATIDCGLGYTMPPERFEAQTWGAYAETVECIGQLCSVASEHGIQLNIENTMPNASGRSFMSTPDEIKGLIRDVGAPNLKACLDTGHCTLAGGDPAQFVTELGDALGETHFQDNYAPRLAVDATGPADLHRPPGIGLIDWPGVMQALTQIDFPGPVVFELGRFWDADSLRTHAQTAYRNWRELENVWHMMAQRAV